MPYEWTKTQTGDAKAEVHLWPHRSLPRRGFAVFIGITGALVLVPLLAVLGTPVLWGILPFVLAAIGGVWWAFERSYRDGGLTEVMTLTPDQIRLVRTEPGGKRLDWTANPYWAEVRLHPSGGPVEDYLTLRGGDREVELGAFLSPPERQALHGELRETLARLRKVGDPPAARPGAPATGAPVDD